MDKIDKIDMNIIKELVRDSSLSNREIGEKLYISSQAISQRIIKLKKQGLLYKYTVDLNLSNIIYIEVYLSSNQFNEFEMLVKGEENILSCEKIEGSFCYLIKYFKDDEDMYKKFLLKIEKYARYKIEKVNKKII